MIFVGYDEPTEDDWAAWNANATAAQDTLSQAFRFGVKPEINENTYKAMRKYLLKRFFHKCAYCDTSIRRYTVDVEHYRPKGRVTDINRKIVKIVDSNGIERDHPGYYWKVYSWNNFLPSCEFCNRKRYHEEADATWGKETCFPVENGLYNWSPTANTAECPLLLNPRFDNPANHINFIFRRDPATYAPYGFVTVKDARGDATIRLLGLDEERLNRARAEAYVEGYNALANVFGKLLAIADMPEDQRGPIRLSARQLKIEVNAIWNGEKDHSAFGRLGILNYLGEFREVLGYHIDMPLPI
jgi:hypothetical protein